MADRRLDRWYYPNQYVARHHSRHRHLQSYPVWIRGQASLSQPIWGHWLTVHYLERKENNHPTHDHGRDKMRQISCYLKDFLNLPTRIWLQMMARTIGKGKTNQNTVNRNFQGILHGCCKLKDEKNWLKYLRPAQGTSNIPVAGE